MANEPTPTETAEVPSSTLSAFHKGIVSMADELEAATTATKAIATPPTKPAKASEDAPPSKPAETAKSSPAAKQGEPQLEEGEKWPRTAKDWDAFKKARKEREDVLSKERDELKKRLSELEPEYKALKEKPQLPADYEQLKKERDAYDEQLKLLNVERHPKFKAYYEGKTNTVIESAKRIVGKDKANDVERILKMPDGDFKDTQLEELISDLSPIKQSQVGAAINELSRIESERQGEIANAKANYEKVMADQQGQAQSAYKQAEQLVDSVIKELSEGDKAMPFLQSRKDDENWNKDVQQRLELTKRISLGGTKDPKDFVKIIANGLGLPVVLTQLDTALSRIAELEAQNASLSAAQPKTGEGAGAAPSGDLTEEMPKNANPQDITRWWGRQVQRGMGT